MRKADNLPPSCADCQKFWGLNLLEPCGLVQACNGTALLYLLKHSLETVYIECLQNVDDSVNPVKIKTNLYCIKFQIVPHREHGEFRLR